MVFFVSPSVVEVSSTLLFFVGVCGVAINRRSVLLVLISVELILLAVNIKLIASSVYLDDLMGYVFSLFVLTVAAAESSIGLAILVSFFRTRGSITIYNSALIRGLLFRVIFFSPPISITVSTPLFHRGNKSSSLLLGLLLKFK